MIDAPATNLYELLDHAMCLAAMIAFIWIIYREM